MKITSAIFLLEYLLASQLPTTIAANDHFHPSGMATAETTYAYQSYQPYYRPSSIYASYRSRLSEYERRYPYYRLYYGGYNRGYYNGGYRPPLHTSGFRGIPLILGGLASGGYGYGGYGYGGINTNVFAGDSIINQNQHIHNDLHHSHNDGHFFDGSVNGGHFHEYTDESPNHGSDFGGSTDNGNSDNVADVGEGSDFGADVGGGGDGDVGGGGDGDVGGGDDGDVGGGD